MNPILKNIVAVIAGFVVGSIVNMVCIKVGGILVPPPPGADLNTMEGLKAAMPMFGLGHFLVPFIAHAFGTLAGASMASNLAASHRFQLAMLVGVLFLAGGVAAAMMLPAPMWFNALDLLLAYMPMAWIGWRFLSRKA